MMIIVNVLCTVCLCQFQWSDIQQQKYIDHDRMCITSMLLTTKQSLSYLRYSQSRAL